MRARHDAAAWRAITPEEKQRETTRKHEKVNGPGRAHGHLRVLTARVGCLHAGFAALVQADGLVLQLDRPNKAKFVRNFNAFLVNVRGCLLVK